MNPLQEKAMQLRAELQKQAATEKGYQQQHKQIVGEQITKLFSGDFPQLYQLLVQSQVTILGETNHQGQQVILSAADKQLTIFYEGVKHNFNTWRFHGKDYQGSSIASEQQFIIALAEAFSLAQSKRGASK